MENRYFIESAVLNKKELKLKAKEKTITSKHICMIKKMKMIIELFSSKQLMMVYTKN